MQPESAHLNHESVKGTTILSPKGLLARVSTGEGNCPPFRERIVERILISVAYLPITNLVLLGNSARC